MHITKDLVDPTTLWGIPMGVERSGPGLPSLIDLTADAHKTAGHLKGYSDHIAVLRKYRQDHRKKFPSAQDKVLLAEAQAQREQDGKNMILAYLQDDFWKSDPGKCYVYSFCANLFHAVYDPEYKNQFFAETEEFSGRKEAIGFQSCEVQLDESFGSMEGLVHPAVSPRLKHLQWPMFNLYYQRVKEYASHRLAGAVDSMLKFKEYPNNQDPEGYFWYNGDTDQKCRSADPSSGVWDNDRQWCTCVVLYEHLDVDPRSGINVREHVYRGKEFSAARFAWHMKQYMNNEKAD